jgi:hypothetical protein
MLLHKSQIQATDLRRIDCHLFRRVIAEQLFRAKKRLRPLDRR